MITSEQVQNKEFTTVGLRRGYDCLDVDRYLDGVCKDLQEIESGRARPDGAATMRIATGPGRLGRHASRGR